MKKAGISFIIILVLLLSGCKSNEDIVNVKNGTYIMVQEDTEEVLLPRITISDEKIMFTYDFLSSYMPYGTYSIDDDILTMTTNDNQYSYVFRIDGDNLVFQKDESSTVRLIDDRLGERITDKAVFHLTAD